MYAITGITGKVGGELARNLLAAGQPVSAIVRNASKGVGCAWLRSRARPLSQASGAITGARRDPVYKAGQYAIAQSVPPDQDETSIELLDRRGGIRRAQHSTLGYRPLRAAHAGRSHRRQEGGERRHDIEMSGVRRRSAPPTPRNQTFPLILTEEISSRG